MKKLIPGLTLIIFILAGCSSAPSETENTPVFTSQDNAEALAQQYLVSLPQIQNLQPTAIEKSKSIAGTCASCWELTMDITASDSTIYQATVQLENNIPTLLGEIAIAPASESTDQE